jgi:hypothetical protein
MVRVHNESLAMKPCLFLLAYLLPAWPQSTEAARIRPPLFSGAMVRVSPESPFAAGCAGVQTGTNSRNGPVEPFVAVDPNRPEHLVGAWQQDRWSNGGANGLLSAVSMDRGRTWTASFARFSICSGGEYQRASDPWVAIAPDGTAHQVALGVNSAGAPDAVNKPM